MADVYIIILLLILLTIILIIFLVKKKFFLMEIPYENAEELKNETIEIFKNRGYKVNDRKNILFVEHTIFSACKLEFEQDESKVIINRYNMITTTAAILIILGLFFTLGLLSIVFIFVMVSNSRRFAKDVILNLIKYYRKVRCDFCNEKIPYDSKVCPYCSKKIMKRRMENY